MGGGGLPKNAQQHSEPKTADAWVKLSLFSKAFIHAAAMAASLLVYLDLGAATRTAFV